MPLITLVNELLDHGFESAKDGSAHLGLLLDEDFQGSSGLNCLIRSKDFIKFSAAKRAAVKQSTLTLADS